MGGSANCNGMRYALERWAFKIKYIALNSNYTSLVPTPNINFIIGNANIYLSYRYQYNTLPKGNIIQHWAIIQIALHIHIRRILLRLTDLFI